MKRFRKRVLATLCLSMMSWSTAQVADAAKPEIPKSADIVIIGAGAADTSATIASAEKGAKIVFLTGKTACCRWHR